MILLTQNSGPPFALNPDLIEKVEAAPETVITLVDGSRYVIVETLEEVVSRVREARASVIALADRMRSEDAAPAVVLQMLRTDPT